MRGTIGLLLYVAVMVLASILKKMAEDKARQTRTLVADEGESYTVTLDDMLAGELSAGESAADEGMETSTIISGFDRIIDEDVDGRNQDMEDSDNRDDWDEWDEWEWEERETQSVEDAKRITDPMEAPQQPNWAQALVWSEIIREPRAKRAWPNR